MARPYFEQLTKLVEQCDLDSVETGVIEVRHFFSGAAVYSNGAICASLSPMGLAFRLPQSQVEKLIKSGKATYLKYFKQGNIKKEYAMFEDPNLNQIKRWNNYLLKSLAHNNAPN